MTKLCAQWSLLKMPNKPRVTASASGLYLSERKHDRVRAHCERAWTNKRPDLLT